MTSKIQALKIHYRAMNGQRRTESFPTAAAATRWVIEQTEAGNIAWVIDQFGPERKIRVYETLINAHYR